MAGRKGKGTAACCAWRNSWPASHELNEWSASAQQSASGRYRCRVSRPKAVCWSVANPYIHKYGLLPQQEVLIINMFAWLLGQSRRFFSLSYIRQGERQRIPRGHVMHSLIHPFLWAPETRTEQQYKPHACARYSSCSSGLQKDTSRPVRTYSIPSPPAAEPLQSFSSLFSLPSIFISTPIFTDALVSVNRINYSVSNQIGSKSDGHTPSTYIRTCRQKCLQQSTLHEKNTCTYV